MPESKRAPSGYPRIPNSFDFSASGIRLVSTVETVAVPPAGISPVSWTQTCSVTGSEAASWMGDKGFADMGDDLYVQAMQGAYEWVGDNGLWTYHPQESVTYVCSLEGNDFILTPVAL